MRALPLVSSALFESTVYHRRRIFRVRLGRSFVGRIASFALAAALSVTGLFASPALAASAHTWSVQAGSIAFGSAGPVGGGNRFYPAVVSIHHGDSIAFHGLGAHLLAVNRPAGPIFTLFGP